ncbi:MAG TPA: ABC transporter permease [Allosphingosinicella sp.]
MGWTRPESIASRFSLLFYLARRELARRYAGSLLGPAWALVFPALQIALYWSVFRFGLKVESHGAIPLGPMLIAGMLPWFALAEALTTMTASLKGNASLVKRTALPAELLPLSSLAAAACVHFAVLVLAAAMLWLLGHPPGPNLAILAYAALCVAALALSLGTLLALANVAFSDVAQATGALLLLWFWATPILWDSDALPAGWRWVGSANPLTHVVESYRYALLGPAAGGFDPAAALSFWGVASLSCLAAWLALGRFKREVADLL